MPLICGKEFVRDGMRFRKSELQDRLGRKINFWTDPWVPNLGSLNQWLNTNDQIDINAGVADLFCLLCDNPCNLVTWATSADGTFTIRRSLVEAFQIFVLPPQQHLLLGNAHINWVRWERPKFGWSKLNSDGSSVVSTQQGACGGIFRNHHGNFLLAYATHLQNVSPLEAELIGILKGLQFAWRNKYNNLIVEVDSAHALRLLTAGCQESHLLHSFLIDIQTLVQRAWLVHFHHTLREANQVANSPAAYGLQLSSDDSDCIFQDILAFLSCV
ncbi:Ribonuclease H domain [Sesbania bispinosa]|nr:Ribonuclease H domain [Sesbania bispinosa]